MFGEDVDQIIEERFRSVRSLLTFIKGNESDATPPVDTDDVKALRGLFFVHLYGAFEKSVTETVQAYLRKVSLIEVSCCHIGFSMWLTAFDAKFRSIQDAQGRGGWKKRKDFVAAVQSQDACVIADGVFSDRLQNVRPEVIRDIFEYLGLSSVFLNESDCLILNEVVEKRNQVAHGRTDPVVIGSASTSADLESRFGAIYGMAFGLLASMREQLADLYFVKDQHRPLYQERLVNLQLPVDGAAG